MSAILEGMLQFAAGFRGEVTTETMLIKGVNSIPTRPPAESWDLPAEEDSIHRAYQRFAEELPRVELLGFRVPVVSTTEKV
jgi:wyosine [tRNA(Phe)-imidazoG37] synthetase (radical SAM superfamily)